MSYNLLNIRIDQLKQIEVVDKVHDFLESAKQHHIATVNPEFIVDAFYDKKFLEVLNRTSLNTVDGFGIKFVSLLKGNRSYRCTGINLINKLIRTDYIASYKIFLLGGRAGVSYAAAKKMRTINPNLQIVGYISGFSDINNPSLVEYNEIIGKINKAEPDILLVGYNAPFAQIFIDEWLSKIPSVRVAIGVGGSLDFLAGNIKRAPKLFRVVGLEWLYRLILQPSRIKRIYKAVFKFLYLYFKYDGKDSK